MTIDYAITSMTHYDIYILSSPFFQCEYFAGYKQAYRREDDIATVNAGMRVMFQENSNIVKELTLAYGGMAITTVMPTQSMKAAVGRYALKTYV